MTRAMKESPDAAIPPELQELVGLADQLRRAYPIEEPDASYVRNAECRILNQLGTRSEARTAPSARPIWRLQAQPLRVLLAAVLAFVMLFGTFGVVSASASALPGDLLYPVKRGLEQAELMLTFNDDAEFALLQSFSDKRIEEIEALAAAERFDDLDDALQEYQDSVDDWLGTGAAMSGADDDGESAFSSLDHHIETLERVQMMVPDQAQEAIRHALERAEAHRESHPVVPNNHDEAQSDHEQEQEERREQREQEQMIRTAEQIARKYETTTEDVLGIYQGVCDADWPCVRAYYRELESH